MENYTRRELYIILYGTLGACVSTRLFGFDYYQFECGVGLLLLYEENEGFG
jgi:hypothetical protein